MSPAYEEQIIPKTRMARMALSVARHWRMGAVVLAQYVVACVQRNGRKANPARPYAARHRRYTHNP